MIIMYTKHFSTQKYRFYEVTNKKKFDVKLSENYERGNYKSYSLFLEVYQLSTSKLYKFKERYIVLTINLLTCDLFHQKRRANNRRFIRFNSSISSESFLNKIFSSLEQAQGRFINAVLNVIAAVL